MELNEAESPRILEKTVFVEHDVPDSYSNAVRLSSKTGNNNVEQKKKKKKKNQQQEDRILFRHVPKKKIVEAEESRELVFVQSSKFVRSFDWDLDGEIRVRPSSANQVGCRVLGLDLNLKSPSSSEISSLSEWSPLVGETFDEKEEDPSSELFSNATTLQAFEVRSPDDVTPVELVQVSPEEPGLGTEDAGGLDTKSIDGGGGEGDGTNNPRLNYFSGYFREDGTTEFDYLRMTNIRRSSSVKISLSSSSESSPSKKKAVRFADALGLELETVNHIVTSTTADPPIHPLKFLRGLRTFEPVMSGDKPIRVLQLCPCFPPPSSSAAFLGRVYEQKVALESLTVDDSILSVTGSVCVVNIAYVKRICVRFTTSGWLDHGDLEAGTYLGAAHGGQVDRFQFRIDLSSAKSFGFGSRLEFAIRYETLNQVHWDNNFRLNYRVECYYKRVP